MTPDQPRHFTALAAYMSDPFQPHQVNSPEHMFNMDRYSSLTDAAAMLSPLTSRDDLDRYKALPSPSQVERILELQRRPNLDRYASYSELEFGKPYVTRLPTVEEGVEPPLGPASGFLGTPKLAKSATFKSKPDEKGEQCRTSTGSSSSSSSEETELESVDTVPELKPIRKDIYSMSLVETAEQVGSSIQEKIRRFEQEAAEKLLRRPVDPFVSELKRSKAYLERARVHTTNDNGDQVERNEESSTASTASTAPPGEHDLQRGFVSESKYANIAARFGGKVVLPTFGNTMPIYSNNDDTQTTARAMEAATMDTRVASPALTPPAMSLRTLSRAGSTFKDESSHVSVKDSIVPSFSAKENTSYTLSVKEGVMPPFSGKDDLQCRFLAHELAGYSIPGLKTTVYSSTADGCDYSGVSMKDSIVESQLSNVDYFNNSVKGGAVHSVPSRHDDEYFGAAGVVNYPTLASRSNISSHGMQPINTSKRSSTTYSQPSTETDGMQRPAPFTQEEAVHSVPSAHEVGYLRAPTENTVYVEQTKHDPRFSVASTRTSITHSKTSSHRVELSGALSGDHLSQLLSSLTDAQAGTNVGPSSREVNQHFKASTHDVLPVDLAARREFSQYAAHNDELLGDPMKEDTAQPQFAAYAAELMTPPLQDGSAYSHVSYNPEQTFFSNVSSKNTDLSKLIEGPCEGQIADVERGDVPPLTTLPESACSDVSKAASRHSRVSNDLSSRQRTTEHDSFCRTSKPSYSDNEMLAQPGTSKQTDFRGYSPGKSRTIRGSDKRQRRSVTTISSPFPRSSTTVMTDGSTLSSSTTSDSSSKSSSKSSSSTMSRQHGTTSTSTAFSPHDYYSSSQVPTMGKLNSVLNISGHSTKLTSDTCSSRQWLLKSQHNLTAPVPSRSVNLPASTNYFQPNLQEMETYAGSTSRRHVPLTPPPAPPPSPPDFPQSMLRVPSVLQQLAKQELSASRLPSTFKVQAANKESAILSASGEPKPGADKSVDACQTEGSKRSNVCIPAEGADSKRSADSKSSKQSKKSAPSKKSILSKQSFGLYDSMQHLPSTFKQLPMKHQAKHHGQRDNPMMMHFCVAVNLILISALIGIVVAYFLGLNHVEHVERPNVRF
ncbi:serine-rich adhesin for platelets-like [Ornithodoros turicata]|uniref:serine-rich adhesin for platelets-like n=1 Tax=Ornithodoros turicata TaxID=34597 RepID=UPI003138E816